MLLDKSVIQGQRFLDVFAVIIPIIPYVEFTIKGEAFLFMFLFLYGEQNFAVLDANWEQFRLEIINELGEKKLVWNELHIIEELTSSIPFPVLIILTSVM